MHPPLLFQVEAEPLRCPDIKGQAQLLRWRLQRAFQSGKICHIGAHWAARAASIPQRHHAAFGETRQPALHRFDRTPAPARDAFQIVTQPCGFDHLQPLAHPPRQLRALQLPLDFLTLLGRDGDARSPHPRAPSPLPRVLPVPRLSEAYPLSAEFTSAYLAWIIHGG
jgi:hypothetical protein